MIQWRKWALSSSEGAVGKANLKSGVKFYRDQPFPLSSCAILIWSPILANLRFSLVAQLWGTLWVTLIYLYNFFCSTCLHCSIKWISSRTTSFQTPFGSCMDVNFGPFQLYFSLQCATFLWGWLEWKVLVMKILYSKQKPKKKQSFEGREEIPLTRSKSLL